jgi:hypothetical protein
MTDRELMKWALYALEGSNAYDWPVVEELKERLAQPEQEPVAVLHRNTQFGILRIEYTDEITELDDGVFNLYAELQEKKE